MKINWCDGALDCALKIRKLLDQHKDLLDQCEKMQIDHQKTYDHLELSGASDSAIETVVMDLYEKETKLFEPIEKAFDDLGFNLN